MASRDRNSGTLREISSREGGSAFLHSLNISMTNVAHRYKYLGLDHLGLGNLSEGLSLERTTLSVATTLL